MYLFVDGRLLQLVEVTRVLLSVGVVGEDLITDVVVRHRHLQRALVEVVLPTQNALLIVLHLLRPVEV